MTRSENADVIDIPWLLGLLKHECFFVREAAAWPLVELAGPSVLVQLLTAYDLGLDEGHDNDGFGTALFELLELHPTEAQIALRQLGKSDDKKMQGHAAWLLEFFDGENAQLGVQADAANGAA